MKCSWGTQSNNSHWNERRGKETWNKRMNTELKTGNWMRKRQVERRSRKTNEGYGWEIEKLSERRGHRLEYIWMKLHYSQRERNASTSVKGVTGDEMFWLNCHDSTLIIFWVCFLFFLKNDQILKWDFYSSIHKIVAQVAP